MSKQRLGRRERMARKRKISMRKHGHMFVQAKCAYCSAFSTWEFNPAKAKKIGFDTKMVCVRCKSNIEVFNETCAGAES